MTNSDHDAVAASDRAREPSRFLNREIQWLQFNDRVLHQAMDEGIPLLERVRFLSIFSSNLDEFFMKRVGGLQQQVSAGVPLVVYEGVSPARLLNDIRKRVLPMIEAQSRCYRKKIRPALHEAGIELLRYDKLGPEDKAEADQWYQSIVFPILTPLAVDPGHRFPFISNLSASLGVMLRRRDDDDPLFARVKVPEVVEQWCQIGDRNRFVLLRDIIEANLSDLFPGMEIVSVLPFRVTRNADIEGDDDGAEDLLEQIEAQLRQRRFARVVRLQIGRGAPEELLRFLCEELEIGPDDLYESRGLFNYSSLGQIADLDLPEHRFTPWAPIVPPRLVDRERSIFSLIRDGDVLVHHPYESFYDSVERFVEEAVDDPNVLCIKQALYRTSGDSPFIQELIEAAESGKQVAVLVELRARFEEERNIARARELENAGVHVTHGVVGLKTHTKVTLVVRGEPGGTRCYVHIGTGNYHSSTAKLYEDVGLLTCDPEICEDVIDLFNFITGRSLQHEYEKLLVAPQGMKKEFLQLIRREAEPRVGGCTGRIIAKMNQLQDREVIEALYEASNAGVQIDLIVRGFCTLRPGVSGMSDNIRVTSIVGRFLEHSRIFWFSRGKSDPLDGDFFIGSADWMYRNLHNRVEAACPVEAKALRRRLWEILDASLNDHVQCWDMQPDGGYVQRHASEEGCSAQDRLMLLAAAASRVHEFGGGPDPKPASDSESNGEDPGR